MEDVLDLYHADYDPDHPVVCFDETSRQLVADKRPVIGAKPGRVERYDYEYKRNGTRNLFMFCEPKAGWRHVEVTERRTAVDFAHQMRWLVDDAYPHTETIRLVLDNLNTHKLGSLYDAFKPAEARRIAKRLEFHYTPLHGSWLNMAEIELSVFSNQCLNRRISDEVILKREVSALERKRNEAVAVIDWRFSTQDARTKPGFPILGVFRLKGQPNRDNGMIFRSCKASQSPVYPIRDAILAVNHASLVKTRFEEVPAI